MATANALAGLMKWLHRAQWRDAYNEMLEWHLAPACENADISIGDLPDLIDGHHAGALWGCVLEDFMARDLDDGRNIVDDYLKRRGWKESASSRAYMTALRSSVMSLYEISDIVLDQSFLARDLVRGGEPVRVSERMGTRYLKPWDRMAGRLVQIGGPIEMSGGSLLFDHATSETVLKSVRQGLKKGRAEAAKCGCKVGSSALGEMLSDTETLRHCAFFFTNVWLDDLLQRTLNPALPQMCNTEGDELVLTTVSWPLKPETSANAIRRALDAVPALCRESEKFWNWIGPEKPAGKRLHAASRTLITTRDDGSLVLGNVALKDRSLLLEANSQQRAQRGQALLAPALAGLVGEAVVKSRTVDELMASPRTGPRKKVSSGLSPDQERALVHATIDRHYATLLDQPVPMLGNISPRRAAKSPNSREKLVAWLKGLENTAAKHEPGSAMAGYDVSWIWEELGVATLRR